MEADKLWMKSEDFKHLKGLSIHPLSAYFYPTPIFQPYPFLALQFYIFLLFYCFVVFICFRETERARERE